MANNKIKGVSINQLNPIYGYLIGRNSQLSYNLSHKNNSIDADSPLITIGQQVQFIDDGNVEGAETKLPNDATLIGLYSVSNNVVNFKNNYSKLGIHGRPLSLSGTSGVNENNIGLGGDLPNIIKTPTVYSKFIRLQITANTGNGTVSVLQGNDYLDSVV
jgi:hypothetical protein